MKRLQILLVTLFVSLEYSAVAQVSRTEPSPRNDPVVRHSAPPNTLVAGGLGVSFATDTGVFIERFTAEGGKALFEHFSYGIEVYSGQPQGFNGLIVGKSIFCRKSSTLYHCDFYLDQATGETLALDVNDPPVSADRLGHADHASVQQGRASMLYELSIDLPHSYFVMITGNTSKALFDTLALSQQVVNEEEHQVVHNDNWVCFRGLQSGTDHCKANINLETGDFWKADPNGPTRRLFMWWYTGIIPEGAAVWN
jgi:hypothetical protein